MNAYVRAHVSERRKKKNIQTATEAVAIKALHGRTGSLNLIVLRMMHAAYDHIIFFPSFRTLFTQPSRVQ